MIRLMFSIAFEVRRQSVQWEHGLTDSLDRFAQSRLDSGALFGVHGQLAVAQAAKPLGALEHYAAHA
jgi:hypothetical protein